MTSNARVEADGRCPNCGQYKLQHRGKRHLIAGIATVVLSVPWIVILVGFLGIAIGAILAMAGAYETFFEGNPISCRACGWTERT